MVLGAAFAGPLGFRKIRLTGGEPLLRGDIVGIVRGLRERARFRRIALTTNGRALAAAAADLRRAGLDQVNVSLDTLCSGSYREIRGADALGGVLEGIERSVEVGFRKVKVNVVLLRSFSLAEFDSFLVWGRGRRIEIRFIELMPTPGNAEYHRLEHVGAAPLLERIMSDGFAPVPIEGDAGPATVYQKPGDPLRVGFVSAVSRPFCSTCNRLRVTADGRLKLCLFGEESFDLRPLLERGPHAVADAVRNAVAMRQPGDRPTDGVVACERDMSTIGG